MAIAICSDAFYYMKSKRLGEEGEKKNGWEIGFQI
ncbi:hypothetical protein COLO4_37829 [Corchorus olitorius]|uniref:Uncharacterized protein n=1 Tax=Corchorus olitorius TaxID=93759 RepID=A0A1R3FZ45_9ROSI|nr:hypothetical protein COLO4_37829 [Corchorus olitorius]